MRIHWRDPDMSARKWIKAIVLIVGPFFLCYVIGFPMLKAYVLTHPSRPAIELTLESTDGSPVERVGFQASDGVEIVGWFVHGDPDGATVVSSHGSGSTGVLAYYGVKFLNRAGYNVLVFDHRGHGQSGSKFTTMGLLEVRDLVGAVAYLKTRSDVDPNRIGAIGCSMGSGIVIGAAAREPSIKAVVAEGNYADLGQVWDRFGYGGIKGTSLHWSWGPLLKLAGWVWTGEWVGQYKPIEMVGEISPRALLFIHGEIQNSACFVQDARRLYQAAGEPKSLWIVPGSGHCAAQGVHPEDYRARVLQFFDLYLRQE
ncbi:MAG: alpha/beta fold hydrolase [Anaerolineae bacterium]|nr:alpha/beta fold hydrolase [Anaerolineae bacterium]